jgi:hypothetical protein
MAVDQLRLDFPLDELKRRRQRQRRPAPTGKAPPQPVAGEQLMTAPVLQQCGFCGHRQTVAGETTLCDRCGGIIIRDETAT